MIEKEVKSEIKNNFIVGLKDGLPIGLGYLSVAFAFGVKASLLGLPAILTILISMTNLTSAGQLAGITVIAEAGTLLEMAATQLVINARYALMSVALSQKAESGYIMPKRLFSSAFVTDEIFAVAVTKPSFGFSYFTGLSLLPYLGWTLGTVLGALLGNVLPAEIQSALGIALYAMFIAIIIPPAEKNYAVLFAVILSAGLSCAFYYIPFLRNSVSSGFAVIICALVSAAICAAIFPAKEEQDE